MKSAAKIALFIMTFLFCSIIVSAQSCQEKLAIADAHAAVYARNSRTVIWSDETLNNILNEYFQIFSECEDKHISNLALLRAQVLSRNKFVDETQIVWLKNILSWSSNTPGESELAAEAYYQLLYTAGIYDCNTFKEVYYEDFFKQYARFYSKERIDTLGNFWLACNDLNNLYSNQVEIIKDSTAKNALDVVIFGDGYDAQNFKKVAVKIITNANSLFASWDVMAEKDNQDLFRYYLYKKPLEDSSLKSDLIGIKQCKYSGEDAVFFKKITKQLGAENYVVFINYACRSNADFFEGTRISFADLQGFLLNAASTLLGNEPDAEVGVFVHETGHSYFGLSDEYNEYDPIPFGPAGYPKYPNCAETEQKANEWWGEYIGWKAPGYDQISGPLKDAAYVGVFEGCGGGVSNYRPTKNSIMNNPVSFILWGDKESYGKVNGEHIRKVLDNVRSYGVLQSEEHPFNK